MVEWRTREKYRATSSLFKERSLSGGNISQTWNNSNDECEGEHLGVSGRGEECSETCSGCLLLLLLLLGPLYCCCWVRYAAPAAAAGSVVLLLLFHLGLLCSWVDFAATAVAAGSVVLLLLLLGLLCCCGCYCYWVCFAFTFVVLLGLLRCEVCCGEGGERGLLSWWWWRYAVLMKVIVVRKRSVVSDACGHVEVIPLPTSAQRDPSGALRVFERASVTCLLGGKRRQYEAVADTQPTPSPLWQPVIYTSVARKSTPIDVMNRP